MNAQIESSATSGKPASAKFRTLIQELHNRCTCRGEGDWCTHCEAVEMLEAQRLTIEGIAPAQAPAEGARQPNIPALEMDAYRLYVLPHADAAMETGFVVLRDGTGHRTPIADDFLAAMIPWAQRYLGLAGREGDEQSVYTLVTETPEGNVALRLTEVEMTKKGPIYFSCTRPFAAIECDHPDVKRSGRILLTAPELQMIVQQGLRALGLSAPERMTKAQMDTVTGHLSTLQGMLLASRDSSLVDAGGDETVVCLRFDTARDAEHLQGYVLGLREEAAKRPPPTPDPCARTAGPGAI